MVTSGIFGNSCKALIIVAIKTVYNILDKDFVPEKGMPPLRDLILEITKIIEHDPPRTVS